jgi:hypothetical protein
MFNNKKSLLSLAAVAVLSSSTASAGYLPLTTSANDNQWVLFGVSSFKTDGATGATAGVDPGEFTFTTSTTRNTAIHDTAVVPVASDLYGSDGDGNAENGLYVGLNADGYPQLLGKVKILDTAFDYIEVRVQAADDATYSEGDLESTIYIKDGGDSPAFAFTYKKVLEGAVIEYSTADDGSGVKTLVLDSSNSYNNPAVGVLTEGTDGTGAAEGTDLRTITSVLDYDFTNNPTSSDSYTVDDHYNAPDTANGEHARLYSYVDGDWKLFDSRNPEFANDFISLQKGQGYWGRMDLDTIKKAGAVLGTAANASVTAADYENIGDGIGLVDGWNLLSFDAQSPDIRVASTGLVVTVPGAADVIIYDASGVFSVTVAAAALSGTAADDAGVINSAIASAKAAGELPRTFNLVAVASGTDLLLVSNEKFILDGTDITVVSTLAGATALAAADTTNTITSLTALQSKHAEYTMVIEPLSANTNAKLQIGVVGTDGEVVDVDATGASIITSNGGALFEAYPVTVDGKTLLVVSSEQPFWVRDHTFTRVFTHNNSGDSTIAVASLGAATHTPAAATDNATLATYVTNLNIALGGSTELYAYAVGADAVGVSSTHPDSASFYLVETAGDNLTPTSSGEDVTRGAIKNVYSLNHLTKLTQTNKTYVDFADGAGPNYTIEDNDTIAIAITHALGTTTVTYTHALGTMDLSIAANLLTVFDALVTQINSELAADFVNATVTHNADTVALDSVTLTFTSPDITTNPAPTLTIATGDYTANNTENLAEVGIISSLGTGDITRDLRYNTVFAPNYVLNGPLYTLKEAGFTPRAMVTGTMNLENETVKWDSIDLTRSPSEWLESQDYNLFGVDHLAGYWVYLEADVNARTYTLEDVQWENGPLYAQHFDAADVDGVVSTYNAVSGTFMVSIPELANVEDRSAVRVSLNVGGTDVEMALQSGEDYTATLNSYEVSQTGTLLPIAVKMADGLGYRLEQVDTGIELDRQKPDMPSVTPVDGATTAFASEGASAIMVYSGTAGIAPIGLTGGAGTLMGTYTAEQAAGVNLCSQLTHGVTLNLMAFAIDGGGTPTTGNVSDGIEFSYTPTLKNSMLLEATNNDGTPVSDAVGMSYDETCTAAAELAAHGMKLQVDVEGTTAKLSFQYEPTAVGQNFPNTVYVAGDNGLVIRVDYDDAYATGTEVIFFETNGKVYRYTLPNAAGANATSFAAPASAGAPLVGVTL